MNRNLAKRSVFAFALAAAAISGAQAAVRDPYTEGAHAVRDARDPYSEGARTADRYANGAHSAEPYHDGAHA